MLRWTASMTVCLSQPPRKMLRGQGCSQWKFFIALITIPPYASRFASNTNKVGGILLMSFAEPVLNVNELWDGLVGIRCFKVDKILSRSFDIAFEILHAQRLLSVIRVCGQVLRWKRVRDIAALLVVRRVNIVRRRWCHLNWRYTRGRL